MLSISPGSGLAANISIIIASAIIFASFTFMAYKYHRKETQLRTLLPFFLNVGLLINLFILSFVRTNGGVTMLSVLLLPVTTLWGIVAAWKKHRWVSLINIVFELFLLYVIGMLALIIIALSTKFQ